MSKSLDSRLIPEQIKKDVYISSNSDGMNLFVFISSKDSSDFDISFPITFNNILYEVMGPSKIKIDCYGLPYLETFSPIKIIDGDKITTLE